MYLDTCMNIPYQCYDLKHIESQVVFSMPDKCRIIEICIIILPFDPRDCINKREFRIFTYR